MQQKPRGEAHMGIRTVVHELDQAKDPRKTSSQLAFGLVARFLPLICFSVITIIVAMKDPSAIWRWPLLAIQVLLMVVSIRVWLPRNIAD